MDLCTRMWMVLVSSAWFSSVSAKVAVVNDESESGSVVHKVVVMLQNMVQAADADKKSEEVAFAEFNQWCTNQNLSLTNEITSQSTTMSMSSAEANNLDQEAKALGASIAQLQRELQQATSDLSEADAEREKTHAEFLEQENDYSESVSALRRAITVLEKQSRDVPALVQLTEGAQQLPAKARDMIAAFAEMMSDDGNGAGQAPGHNYTAPEADAYEFQSHSIVEILTKLLDEFEEKLSECQKEEVNSRHNYDMVSQDLKALIERTNEDIAGATAEKQAKHEQSAAAKKDYAKASELKSAGEATLHDVSTECFEKTESFNEKQQLRSEELEALNKAIEILSQDEVQGLAAATLAQTHVVTALAQVNEASFRGTKAVKASGIHRELSSFLSSEAQRLHSSRIEDIAKEAAADPLEKVKVMIRDLMERLLEEAHQDATHEGFCDKELGVNKQKRESLTADIDGLTADIERGSAGIASMTQEAAQLTHEVAEHKASMLQATELRTDEKASNKATVKDCQEGEAAVVQATALLKKFYAKALQSTAFLQQGHQYPHMGSEEWYSLANTSYVGKADLGHKAGMQTFGDVYTGQQEEAGGIIAMLEVILSDFASLRTETEANERTSQKQYEAFMQQSKTDVAVKTKKIQLLQGDKVKANDKLHTNTQDRKYAEDKLEAADRYYEELKDQCFDKGQTYEERTAARAAEIQSLKEALKMLSYEDIASANDQAGR